MEATAKRTADGTTRVPPVDDLISFHAVATRAGVTYATVVNWSKRPTSPLASWKVGGKRFTTQAAFTAFVEAGVRS